MTCDSLSSQHVIPGCIQSHSFPLQCTASSAKPMKQPLFFMNLQVSIVAHLLPWRLCAPHTLHTEAARPWLSCYHRCHRIWSGNYNETSATFSIFDLGTKSTGSWLHVQFKKLLGKVLRMCAGFIMFFSLTAQLMIHARVSSYNLQFKRRTHISNLP